jgi:UDP-N-acetylglucosamine 2-epimerase
LDDPAAYDAMALVHNPYGDGHACERIEQRLSDLRIAPSREGGDSKHSVTAHSPNRI